MNDQMYKWLMIATVIVIGVLQFFDLSPIFNYVLFIVASLSAIMYVRLKLKRSSPS